MLNILTLIKDIVKQIRQLLEILTTKQDVTLDEIESLVWKLVLEMGRLMIEGIIRIRGTGYVGKTIQTPSGDIAIYNGNQDKIVWTLMGSVTIKRAYYYIGKGKGGYVPLDESLSIPQGHYSYATQEAISLLAIEDSFGESEKKIKHFFPIEISDSTIRNIAFSHGRGILHGEKSKVKAIFTHKQPVPEPEIKSVQRGYIGIDGVMVPTRQGYKEMKVAVSYDTPAVKDALANNLHYMALFAKPEEFGEHLWVMLQERGIYGAADRVWVSDGAKWEWKLKQYHDPDGREILDLIHAIEHIVDLGRAAYGEGTEESTSWIETMKDKLRREGGKSVLMHIQELSGKGYQKELSETIEYYLNNVDRMKYPEYEKEGYHITSSPVESSCRHVVGDRLKRSGMRWTEEGAQYIISLRLRWKNGKWESHWASYRPSLVNTKEN